MFCQECGNQFEGKFCPNCGTYAGTTKMNPPVQQETIPSDPARRTKGKKVKKSKKKGMGCLIPFLAVIVVIFLLFMALGDGGVTVSVESESAYSKADTSDSNNDVIQGLSDPENKEKAAIGEDQNILNYDLYSDNNISVNLEQITEEGALFIVENKLDQAIYYTNYVFSFDGYNLSDSAGLVYNSVLIAPHSSGKVLTKAVFYTDNPSFIYGRAFYGTEDDTIDEDIVFSYGDEKGIPEGSVFDPGTPVYEDDYIKVEFDAVDTEEYDGASFIVINKSDYLLSYVNSSIAFDGVSYTDGAGLVYNSAYIAPKSTGKIITKLTEAVSPDVEIISGSGRYFVEEIDYDKDFSYTDTEVK